MNLDRSTTKSRYLWIIPIITILLVLRDIGNFAVNKYIFVGICAIFFYISSLNELVISLSFIAPLLYGLPGNYIMPLALIIYLIKKRRISKEQFFYIIFIAGMEFVAARRYSSLQIDSILGYISIASLFFVMINEKSELDYEKCLRAFVLGITVICSVVIVSTIKNAPSNWIAQLSSGYFRFGVVEDTTDGLRLSLNANAMSFFSIAGISIIMVLLKKGRSENRTFLYAEFIILLLAGLLSLSRMWFIDGIVCVFFFIIFSGREKGFVLRGIGILALIIIGIFVIDRYLPSLTVGIRNRFEREDLLTGNQRFSILKDYLNAFTKKPSYLLLGTGVTQYSRVLGLSGHSIHTGIVQILICYGVVGFVVFMYGWLKPILASIKRIDKVYFVPFICVFVYSLSAQFVNPWYLLFPHLFAVYTVLLGNANISNEVIDEI